MINILEGLFSGGGGRGINRLAAHAIKHTARFGFGGNGILRRFEAEEGILQGSVKVGGVQFYGAMEVFPGGTIFADLQAGIGCIFMNRGASGVKR